jgi:hypothetical protein
VSTRSVRNFALCRLDPLIPLLGNSARGAEGEGSEISRGLGERGGLRESKGLWIWA